MLAIMTALAASASVVYLQRRFDAADEKNGVEIAQKYRAPSGRTLVDVLEQRHPRSTVSWSGFEQSSCFQHVRVDARVSLSEGGLPLDYQFDIDLNGPSIHPANPLGAEAIAALDKSRAAAAPLAPSTSPTGTAAGSPSASTPPSSQ